jgi:carbon-monoxide dehydrogenase large subunit
MPKDHGIGASSKRREDVRFLTGRGRYTDDINLRGQTHAVFVRSQVAHGRIRSIDAGAAEAMPGVLKVFTAKDFEGKGGVPCGWQIHDRQGKPMLEPKHPILAEGKVRYVGDAIACVVAETLEQARDAAEAVEVDIEELPAVIDMKAAVRGGALVHDELGSNLCYDWGFIEDNKAPTDAAFAKAHHVTTLELVNNRLIPNAMEPRVAIGDYDFARDDYTLYTTSQNPHVIRLLMGAFVLSIPEHKLRVVAPDVGGGFGSKIFHYIEEAFVTHASRVVGRPVKWTCTRQGGPLPCAQDRDLREHGGLSFHLRALDPDLPARHADGGDLQDATDLREREGGLHQHRAGGCLPRRRPARGDLPA